MPRTVANQRVVRIHRQRASSDFLGIKNANWQYAARDLGAFALMLYLYLAANADGFSLALSPAAIRQAIGMPPQTYRDQFIKLIDKGYLVQSGNGNTYDFYEVPQARAPHTTEIEENAACAFDCTTDGFEQPQGVENAPTDSREININNIDNIDNAAIVKQVSQSTDSDFDF